MPENAVKAIHSQRRGPCPVDLIRMDGMSVFQLNTLALCAIRKNVFELVDKRQFELSVNAPNILIVQECVISGRIKSSGKPSKLALPDKAQRMLLI